MVAKKSFLIIEDEKDMSDFIQDTLNLEYSDSENADVAKNIYEANTFVDNFKYDCIMLDLNLSGLNGGIVAKHIQSNSESINHETPIIVISGIVKDSGLDKYIDKYFSAINKPFEAPELLSSLKVALNS